MMFNLEDEINSWLREIRRYPNFEDGDIAEIEDHIREVIEHGLDDGLTPNEAFMKATSSFGSLEAAGVEITKSKTSGMKIPKSDPFAHDYTSTTNKFRSTTIMFSNYAKIAARNVRKQKLYSFINILSLTIGLTATILIFLFVHDELTFDQFNADKNNIYRVLQVQKNVEGSLDYKGTSHAISLGPEIVSNISGISATARFFEPWENDDHYIRVNDKTLVDKVLYGDFEVFNMFTFPVLQGSIEGDSPFEVVLSTNAAYKYFADEVAVGKTLSIRIDDSFVDFTVAAVVDNIPSNSSIHFDLLVNFSYLTEVGFMKDYVTNWGFGAINTYVQTEPGAALENIQPGLDKLLSSHYPYYAEIAEQRGYKTALDYRQLSLQPLLDIHFDNSVTEGLVPSSNRLYSILLGLIAIGILLIGCINFMNLSIGRSANRAKEIGLRKTIGATRNQLIVQFLSESIILSILAALMAFLTAYFLLPIFNLITDKELTLTLLFEPYYFLLIIGVTLLTGFLSGVYPAFALSKFKVEDAFSGSLRLGGANTFTRILVVVQFSLATLLIIGMIVITEQMRYIQDKDLGFDSEQVLVIPNNTINQTTIFTHYKQVLTEVPGVLSVTTADQIFGNHSGLGGMGFEYKNKPMRVGIIRVSDNYLETLGIQLLSGRGFDPQVSSDYTRAVIINEACLKDFELNLNDVFESLGRSDNPEDDPVVIGVMKDFNYGPLTMNVDPMLIKLSKHQGLSYIMVKVSPENMASTIKSLDNAWKEVAAGLPFEYEFLDDTMGEQYAAQKEWSKIISISMITAILLSCFGLFGLVAMAIAGKRSEIGVRKVLGAGIGQIVRLYSWQYTRLVLLAFIIAMPVSYFLLEKWLETFAYRIVLDFKIYFIAGLVSLGIAWITIAYKIFEAALINPAQVLRDE